MLWRLGGKGATLGLLKSVKKSFFNPPPLDQKWTAFIFFSGHKVVRGAVHPGVYGWGGSWSSQPSSGPAWPPAPLWQETLSGKNIPFKNRDEGRMCVTISRWRQMQPRDTGWLATDDYQTHNQTCSTWPNMTGMNKDYLSEDDMNKRTNT